VWRQVDAQVLERNILPAFGSDKPTDGRTHPGTGYPSKSRQTNALAQGNCVLICRLIT